MAVDRPPREQGDLVQQAGVAAHHPRKIHDLGQTQDSFPAAEFFQVRGRKFRPGGLQGRGRDAGRQHEEKIQGQPGAGGEHVVQADGAPDVGDLMGVRHHRGGPQGQQGPGQFPGRQHAALQVEVAVDEAGHDITTLDLQPGAVVISQSRNDAIKEGHVNFLPPAGVDVGHLSARQHQVRRGLPPGHAQPLLQSFLRHVAHLPELLI